MEHQVYAVHLVMTAIGPACVKTQNDELQTEFCRPGLILEDREAFETLPSHLSIFSKAVKENASSRPCRFKKWAYALIAASIPCMPSNDIKRLKL